MEIRTGGFAYYFCNRGELSAFTKRYGNKISNVDGMLYVYSYRYNTFNFIRKGERYIWQYDRREYYIKIGYEVIPVMHQRSE